MELHFTPPACVTARGEEIRYCVPFDRIADGTFIGDGFISVSPRAIYISRGDKITAEYPLDRCDDVHCAAFVGGGALVVKLDGADCRAALFSSKHLSRISSVARGALLLARGEQGEITNSEYEKTCTRCGRALPGTRSCPHCDGKGRVMFARIADIFKSNRKSFVLISALMLINALANIILPDVQKRFIDGTLLGRQGNVGSVIGFISVYVGVILVSIITGIFKNRACVGLGADVAMELREKLYHKIQILTLSFIGDRRPGTLMNRIMHDTDTVRRFIQDAFGNMFTMLVTMIVAIIIMLTINPLLTLISLLLIPVVAFLTMAWRKNIHRRFHMQWRKDDRANSALQDAIAGMRVVKSFGKEKTEAEKIDAVNHAYAEIQKKNEVFWASFYPLLTFIMGAGAYLVTYFGGASVLNGDMSIGTLTQFIAYAGILYGPLGWMTHLPRMITMAITSLERIYDILDEEPAISERPDAKDVALNGDIEFKDVTFGYHSYEPVLEHIDLSVKSGEMIGLVGASGTGKSTMINLLMHLYEVDNGEITISGTNISEIKADCFHDQIGVVLQETFLFSGTILNNLRFAKPDATYEEIIQAAKMANAHDFIIKTPDGYNTYVGEHGYNLSGGERQRIAIARAILNDPCLLILDEATSNLDTESEYLIQKALSRLTQGRTTFAIAHRLSTLKDADRLVVIDGHSIAEIGSHNELMEKKGIYYGLVTAQLEMQALNDDE